MGMCQGEGGCRSLQPSVPTLVSEMALKMVVAKAGGG